MKTAMQNLLDKIENKNGKEFTSYYTEFINEALEEEKEQLQKAFSDGQETPLNHPTLPHYSRKEYYNDNYNQNK